MIRYTFMNCLSRRLCVAILASSTLIACDGDGGGAGGSLAYIEFVTNGGGPELFVQDSDPRHAFEIDNIFLGDVYGTEAWLIEGTYCRGETFEGTHDDSFEASFCIENSAGLDRLGQPTCYTGGVVSTSTLNFNGESYSITDQNPGC